MILHLIRHGESQAIAKGFVSGHLPGIWLTPEGERQAARVAERLAVIPIRAIYSSPLERTLQTAEPLAIKLGLPVTPEMSFIEFDVGDWEGKTFTELETIPQWKAFRELRSLTRADDHGETMLEVQNRAIWGLEKLSSLHPEDIVALFSHGDVIRVILLYCLGMPIDFYERLLISPGGISTLELLPERAPQLLSLNGMG